MEDTGKHYQNEPADRRGWNVVDWSVWRNPPKWLQGIVIFLAIGIFIYLVLTAVFLIWQAFTPVWSGPELTTEQSRNLLIAIGALIAGPFAIWRIIISHWQARIARENHYTSLFTTAVAQLGTMRDVKELEEATDDNSGKKSEVTIKTLPNFEVRLGGIYALERIAQDSERDHWPIMETLCSYVRNNAGPERPIANDVREALRRLAGKVFPEEDEPLAKERKTTPSVDVRAALSVIGRRPQMRRAYEAAMQQKTAVGSAYCMDLTGTNLPGVRLEGSHFEKAFFSNSNLAFALLARIHLEGAFLNGAHLEGASLEFAHLENSLLTNAHLEGAQCYGARLEGASLYEAHLEGANFNRANLDRAELEGAHLNGVRLKSASLKSAELYEAHLKDAWLEDANLEGAELGKIHLDGAALFGTDLTEAKHLHQDQLDATLGDHTTKLPNGLTRPFGWFTTDLTSADKWLQWNAWRERRAVEDADSSNA